MRLRVRLITVLLILLLCQTALAATPSDWSLDSPEILETGHIFSDSAIVMDTKTGTVLFTKNPDARMYPASTTKIMTLLLALESGIPLETMVTIPAAALDIPDDSARIPVSSGESLSFQDLLYGFMLRSGNDGAIAIAMIVGGSVDNFVALMNSRAAQIGCASTHFTNPHGLHDDNHYTTARDLALISAAAMENAMFRQIVGTAQYTLSATNMHSARDIESRVEMLLSDSKYYYAECTGIKTGYTYKAGQCFVGSAESGGRTIIIVALNSTKDYADRKWFDARCMFEFGFTCYEQYGIQQIYDLADSSINTIQVDNAISTDTENGRLPLILTQTTDDDYNIIVLKNTQEFGEDLAYFNAHTTVTPSADYLARIENRTSIDAGSIVGTLSYTAPDGKVVSGMLIAGRSVELEQTETGVWEYLAENFDWLNHIGDARVLYIVISVVVIILLIITVAIVQNVRRNRRRKRIYEQRRRAYYARMRREGKIPERKPGKKRD